MILRNYAVRTLHVVNLKEAELLCLSVVGPEVDRANDDSLPCDVGVDRSLKDVGGTAVDVGTQKRVWASINCRLGTGPRAKATHCAGVL